METPATNYTFSAWGGACLGSVTCAFTLTATSSVTATFTAATGSLQSINHIILFAQENRSLDHYFGPMEAYWAANPGLGFGASGQTFDGLPQTGTPHSVAQDALPGTWGDSCSPNPGDPISSFHLQSVCIRVRSGMKRTISGTTPILPEPTLSASVCDRRPSSTSAVRFFEARFIRNLAHQAYQVLRRFRRRQRRAAGEDTSYDTPRESKANRVNTCSGLVPRLMSVKRPPSK